MLTDAQSPRPSVPAPALSVIVPAFNEEACIADCVRQLTAWLDGGERSWELIVVDDGSVDRTAVVVRELVGGDGRIRLLHGERRGKGAAVRRGMLEARGGWRFMADADLSMPPDHIGRFFTAVAETSPAAHIAIASREAPGARRIGEPLSRHLLGRVFNLIVQAVAVPGIRDTQCGFKLFSAAVVEALFPHARIDGFAFDVELLFLARKAGIHVKQVPIDWYCRADSRVGVLRGGAAFVDIVSVRWNAWRGRYRGLSATCGALPGSRFNRACC